MIQKEKDGIFMKKRLIAMVLAAALLFSLLFGGCSEFKYIFSNTHMTIKDEGTGDAIYNGQALYTSVSTRAYCFDKSIDRDLCVKFVNSQEILCSLLEQNGIDINYLRFFVLSENINRAYSEQNYAYYGIDSVTSWQQILTTLQLIMGETTNYGYLYALADKIAADYTWTRDQFDEPEISFTEDNIHLLNLVYPCFTGLYSTKQEIDLCKQTAIELLADARYIWSPSTFLRDRISYASSLDLKFKPTELEFCSYGKGYPMVVNTEYLTVYIEPSYFSNTTYYLEKTPIKKVDTVGELINTYEKADSYIAILNDKLGFVPDQRLSVIMTGEMPEGYTHLYAFYDRLAEDPYILSTSEFPLAHEYVHHIVKNKRTTVEESKVESICNEALAYYYTCSAQFEEMLNVFDKFPQANENAQKLIGEPYDQPVDYLLYQRNYFRELEENPDYYDALINTPYYYCLLGEYFIRTYGEDLFIGCMLFPDGMESMIGKTFDEVINDLYLDICNSENDALLVIPELAQMDPVR